MVEFSCSGGLESHANEETILDSPFKAEEVAAAMRKFKAAGLDGIVAEHLKWGGAVPRCRSLPPCCGLLVVNAIVDSEMVPGVLKLGVVVPVYKGSGKDPMSVFGIG